MVMEHVARSITEQGPHAIFLVCKFLSVCACRCGGIGALPIVQHASSASMQCGRRGVVVRLLDDTLPARDMNVE